MLIDFKELFTSRLALFVMVVVALGVVVEGTGRLVGISSHLNSQTNKFMPITPMILPQLDESDLLQLNKAYAPFISKKNDSKTEMQQGLSAAEQANQQGELKSFFVGDNQLKLKAVIHNINTGSVALIELNNIKLGTSKIESFANGQLVYGYKLVISKNTQVMLSKRQVEKLQQITLTMYIGKV
ncbi:MAG: hypothetical protein OCD00_07050 [Colwellia sp.]